VVFGAVFWGGFAAVLVLAPFFDVSLLDFDKAADDDAGAAVLLLLVLFGDAAFLSGSSALGWVFFFEVWLFVDFGASAWDPVADIFFVGSWTVCFVVVVAGGSLAFFTDAPVGFCDVESVIALVLVLVLGVEGGCSAFTLLSESALCFVAPSPVDFPTFDVALVTSLSLLSELLSGAGFLTLSLVVLLETVGELRLFTGVRDCSPVPVGGFGVGFTNVVV